MTADMIQLLQDWSGTLTDNTISAYKSDLLSLAQLLEMEDLPSLGLYLCSLTSRQANSLALQWKRVCMEAFAPSTVNRRLSALSAFVNILRTLDYVGYTIDIKGVKPESRPMEGPTLAELQIMFDYVQDLVDSPNPKKSRKGRLLRAAMRLLYDLGLRREEVVSLDIGDFKGDTIDAHWKGFRLKKSMSLPDPTQKALRHWLHLRKDLDLDHDALFVNASGERLGARHLYNMMCWLGERTIGRPVTPHGLRHTAITVAFEKSHQHQLDPAQLKAFSRHTKTDTLLRYRDRLDNAAGKVAQIIANQVM